MERELLKRLHGYFAGIANPTEEERSIFEQLTGKLPFFHITSVSRDDLRARGFDVTRVSDTDMEHIAREMAGDYCEGAYWDDMEAIASQQLEIPRRPPACCPVCGSELVCFDFESGKHVCQGCGRAWSDNYVLVQFPEDASHFEESEIGYPCFNTEDNGARYVPEYDYIRHFRKDPAANTFFKPVGWPESQNYLGETSIDALCEPIEDEKGLADFGPQTIWVPLCMLGKEPSASEYKAILDEVRNKFADEIAVADADPDKWYEVFVTDDDGGTHTEKSCDTFDEVARCFPGIADSFGVDNTNIDIWQNRESPVNTLPISGKPQRRNLKTHRYGHSIYQ